MCVVVACTATWPGESLSVSERYCLLCSKVLLVSSSRHPDKWIVPGGGMEPEEEPSVAAAREVCEEVGSFLIYYLIMAPFRFVDGSTL